VETLAWLFALYVRYFAAVFVAGFVVLGFLFLLSLRSRSRTSPDPTGAQTSAPDGRTAA
jgi:hypothetical protein